MSFTESIKEKISEYKKEKEEEKRVLDAAKQEAKEKRELEAMQIKEERLQEKAERIRTAPERAREQKAKMKVVKAERREKFKKSVKNLAVKAGEEIKKAAAEQAKQQKKKGNGAKRSSPLDAFAMGDGKIGAFGGGGFGMQEYGAFSRTSNYNPLGDSGAAPKKFVNPLGNPMMGGKKKGKKGKKKAFNPNNWY